MTRTGGIAVLLGVSAAAVMGGAVQASAHPGPPPHDHAIVVDGTERQIGPRVCGVDLDAPQNAGLHRAFHAFHSNVHVGQAGTVVGDHSHAVEGVIGKPCAS